MSHPTLSGTWSYPTRILFGAGRIAELPEACRSLGIAKPLLVTDPGLAERPMIRDAIAANEAAGLPTTLFRDVRPNPTGANVAAGVEAFRHGGHDGVIAFGGGSALDVGKLLAFAVAQVRPLWDFEDVGELWQAARTEGIAPVIAIPTTAGTGSEVGRAAVATNEATGRKTIVFHPRMLPGVVVADPALTTGLPATVTAGTGMDALAHCFEAYCAPGFHPMADGIAVEGMRLIKDWLPTAVRDGANIEARAHMMAAASMGAVAFQKGLGAIHALSHPVGSLYDTHHGLTNGVFMPYVMAFNRGVIVEKCARLAAYLALPEPSFDAVMDWVLALRGEIGIPHSLAELGVEAARIPEMAAMAAIDPTAPTNPVLLDKGNLAVLFRRALEGHVPN